MSVSKASRRKGSAGGVPAAGGPGVSGEGKGDGRLQSPHVARNLSKLWTPNEDWDRVSPCDGCPDSDLTAPEDRRPGSFAERQPLTPRR